MFMSNHYKLEEVTASNDEGDTVIIKRIYEPKPNRGLGSNIGGNIYQPSNRIVMCAEKTGGFNLVNYRHSSGVYHEQETEDLHRRI